MPAYWSHGGTGMSAESTGQDQTVRGRNVEDSDRLAVTTDQSHSDTVVPLSSHLLKPRIVSEPTMVTHCTKFCTDALPPFVFAQHKTGCVSVNNILRYRLTVPHCGLAAGICQ